MKRISLIIVTLFILPIASQAVTAAPDWKMEGVSINTEAVENIEVIQISDDQWRMYYSENGSVKSAISNDGKSWEFEDGVRITNAGQVSVLKLADNTIRIYFTRMTDQRPAVFSAVSSNGLDFIEEEGVRLAAGHAQGFDADSGIVHPSVVKLLNGKYRLYYDTLYTAEDDNDDEDIWRILSATSADGLTFIHDKGVRINPKKDLPPGTSQVWSPHARVKNNKVELYFGAEYPNKPLTRNGIYLAISKTGKKFKVESQPIVYRDAGLKKQNTNQGMNGAPQDPFVLKFNGKNRLYIWVVNKGIITAQQRTK